MPSIGDSCFGKSDMPVIAITLALNTGTPSAVKLATILATEGGLQAGSPTPCLSTATASGPVRANCQQVGELRVFVVPIA